MNLYFGIILTVLSIVSTIEAKTFTECELANKLKDLGFEENQLADWVCLIKAESSMKTGVVGGPNTNKSYDYGLFQINDKYWCTKGSRGKDCNIDCNSLLTDDITAAATCAKFIYKRHKFTAWRGWTSKCDGKLLPSLDHCF